MPSDFPKTQYDLIPDPYNQNMNRESPIDVTSSWDSSTNGNLEQTNTRSSGSMSDIWIKNFIRSDNWSPKKVGFYINGQTGYAEFANVFVSGHIDALSGSIGGWEINGTTITGGTMTLDSAGIISTADSGARVVIDDSNNISLFDNTTSSAGTVTGNASEIRFLRADDESKYFTFRKRVSKNYTDDNVLELFATPSTVDFRNYIFIGRDGVSQSQNVDYIELSVNAISSRPTYSPLVSPKKPNGKIGMTVVVDGNISGNMNIVADYKKDLLGGTTMGIGAALVSNVSGLASLTWWDPFANQGWSTIYAYNPDQNTYYVKGWFAADFLPENNDTYSLGTAGTFTVPGKGGSGKLDSEGHRVKDIYMSGKLVRNDLKGWTSDHDREQPMVYNGYTLTDGTKDSGPALWTSEKTATGTYKITHDFGTPSYYVSLTSVGNPGFIKIGTKSSNYFTVLTYNTGGTAADNSFEYVTYK
jgi:hypothetical protein